MRWGLPDGLADALARRCEALTAMASGRVLAVHEISPGGRDIGGRGAGGSGVEAELAGMATAGDRYDTIISLACTPSVVDMAEFVASLRGLLTADGSLLMVEPVACKHSSVRIGAIRRYTISHVCSVVCRRISLRRRRTVGAGLRTDPGLVAALWGGGFSVTDIHRFEVSSVPAAWRRFAELRARHSLLDPYNCGSAGSSGSRG